MKASKQPDLTIVLPAYREERRIGKTLDELAAFLKQNAFFRQKSVEVLVVAADASDNTDKIALSKKRLFENFRLLKPGIQRGKGRDVQFGMLHARGNYVIFMDADLATPLIYLEKFYMICQQRADIVIGTRNLRRHHSHLSRRLVSNLGNVLFRIISGLWIEDSQCGFKMFKKNASQLCFSKLKIMGWGFDMEILAIAKANNLKISTQSIKDWRDVPDGTFTDNVIKTSLYALKDLYHIALGRINKTYKE